MWYLSEGSGICYLFALCSDIELVLAICQVSVLQRALAGLEDCSGVLLIPESQGTLKFDVACAAAGCAESKGHNPARSTHLCRSHTCNANPGYCSGLWQALKTAVVFF